MPDYSTRVDTYQKHKWIVPTGYERGACWVEISKAIHAAHSEIVSLGLKKEIKDISDDAVWVLPGDEEIVIYFIVETDESGSKRLA